VLMNTNKQSATVNTSRYSERMQGFTQALNVLSNEVVTSLSTLNVPAQTALVLELK
jgi:neopullulanase